VCRRVDYRASEGGDLKEGDCFKYTDADGRIILKWTFNKWVESA
jgi:hypothetical protein